MAYVRKRIIFYISEKKKVKRISEIILNKKYIDASKTAIFMSNPVKNFETNFIINLKKTTEFLFRLHEYHVYFLCVCVCVREACVRKKWGRRNNIKIKLKILTQKVFLTFLLV